MGRAKGEAGRRGRGRRERGRFWELVGIRVGGWEGLEGGEGFCGVGGTRR